MRLRRWWTVRKRKTVGNVWPVMPGSETVPVGWPGWPDGKQFAFVLTHDVEGVEGVERVPRLMALEEELGFRSSFNFIPEGGYHTPPALREELRARGFEVGVHDLRHDGFLYRSESKFQANARRINGYLKDWNAVGFRSGFMLNNLKWLQHLDIAYDASTFDTDPFEPQPEGRQTIFPFWVPHVAGTGAGGVVGARSHPGFVELPYTLPQDSTLFLLLEEKTCEIWKRKLDWIVQHGGMALVNIHPDYIGVTDREVASRDRYPESLVRDFLSYVKATYAGRYWNPLPAELAAWVKSRSVEAVVPNGAAKTAAADPVLSGKRAAVLLYSYYPSDPRPRRAAEALASCGMEVDLLCLRQSESEPLHERINGVNVTRMPVAKKRGSKLGYLFQYGRFILASFFYLLKLGRKHKVDLVHVHNMPDALVFSALPAKLRGARVILDLHDPMPELMTSIYGFSPDHPMVSLLRIVERWSIRFAHLALTPNITFKNLFVSRSCAESKMQIVMNSPNQAVFDPDLYPPGEQSPRDAKEFRIMHHGEIVERHGVDLLVEAVAKVRDKIPGLRLNIYGFRTPFLDKVLEVAERLGVGDIVHYEGPRAQPAIAQAIRDCDLGVVPNRRSAFTEINFPTRIFEFLSMHRPVIAPATQGIHDYFGPGELLTFEPGNVDDLAARIFWVYTHREGTAAIVERGVQVYRAHPWSGERAHFLGHVGRLLG